MQIPSPRPLPRLDVVIVNWNSGIRLDRCLASLAYASRSGFCLDRVVVVDNASEPPADTAIDARRAETLPLAIVANAENRGFAAACTQGAMDSRADYLLFLNPDTRVGVDSLAAAVAALEAPEARQIAILGLQLVDDRGEAQATCGRFLSARRIFNQVTGLSRLRGRWFEGIQMAEWDHRETRPVDYVSGACLLVRRPVFDVLGGFDPRFIVYLEDADLALRARSVGWGTIFLAGPPVYHEGGWGTGGARAVRLAHAWRSLLEYSRKHFSRTDTVAVFGVVLACAPAARVAQAIAHRSVREVREAVVAYGRFWRLMFGAGRAAHASVRASASCQQPGSVRDSAASTT